jgi:hypothetical protein
VPRFIHHLRGGIELCLDIGNLLDNLGGANEGTLFAVQELREVVSLRMAPQLRAFFLG